MNFTFAYIQSRSRESENCNRGRKQINHHGDFQGKSSSTEQIRIQYYSYYDEAGIRKQFSSNSLSNLWVEKDNEWE